MSLEAAESAGRPEEAASGPLGPGAASPARRSSWYMSHNPPDNFPLAFDPVRKMRAFVGPNLVCFTRAAIPPVPGMAGKSRSPVLRKPLQAPGIKGVLKGASQKSLLNLARLLSVLDWSGNGQCLHIVLTYWMSWPCNKAELAAEKAIITSMSWKARTGLKTWAMAL